MFVGESGEFSRSNLCVHGYLFKRAFEAARSAFPQLEARVLEKQSTTFARLQRRCVKSMQTPFWFVISNQAVELSVRVFGYLTNNDPAYIPMKMGWE